MGLKNEIEMNNNQNRDKIRIAAQKILNCGDAIGVMHEAVHEMYAVYASISGIGIQNQNMDPIFLDSGKAISTAEAAHCLLEMVRTTKFLRGIKEAFDAKITDNTTNAPISVLYAGTGPYAALVTPLLLFYSPSQLQIDLLDINGESLRSAIQVIADLGCDQFIRNTFIDDAAKIKLNTAYDVVISETMQAALKKEPQVAIMQNLIPQCSANAIFIPQEITVSAALTSHGKWNAEKAFCEGVQRIELGEIFTVDKNHLQPSQLHNELLIPEEIGECTQLSLYTDIWVYGSHTLGENDCSLNMPFKMCKVDGGKVETLKFWYKQGEVPHICCHFVNADKHVEALNRSSIQILDKHKFTQKIKQYGTQNLDN